MKEEIFENLKSAAFITFLMVSSLIVGTIFLFIGMLPLFYAVRLNNYWLLLFYIPLTFVCIFIKLTVDRGGCR